MIRAAAIPLTAALLLVSCGKSDSSAAPAPAPSQTAAMASAPPVPPAPPTPLPVTARKVSEKNDLYEFTYSYPASAGTVAGLKTSLDADLNTRLAKLKSEAAAARKDAAKDGYPYNPWYWSQEWKVVTDLPGWLSLSAEYANYTGGAHGMQWFGTMLWDRQAGKARDPLSLFQSKAALSSAIRKPFCAELDRQRVKKRGEPLSAARSSMFEECVDPLKQTVIVGSASGKAFDRIGILVAPYEAGPYAEGTYEVTVPVTPAVVAAVRPEFRSSFAALR